MTAIIIPRRHYAQPQGRVAIAPEWLHAHVIRTPADGLPCPNADVVGGEKGLVWSLNGVNQFVDLGPLPNGQSSVTIGALITQNNATNSFPLSSRSLSTTQGIELLSGGGSVFGTASGRVGTSVNASSAYATPSVGGFSVGAHIHIVRYTGYYLHHYANGFLASTSVLANGTVTHSQNLYVGRRGSTFFQGQVALAFAFPDLSSYEIAEVSANPWQLFRADPIRIYSLPTGPIIPYISSVTMSNISQNSATTNIQLTF